jgi:hypothetical protein
MTGILLLLLTASLQVTRLPALSDSCDVIVVLMEDGLLPQEAWQGTSNFQREEFWSLACRGMMVERNGWAGYIILAPVGVGEVLLVTAESLATEPGVPHPSVWHDGMGIIPLSDCPSTILLFGQGNSDPAPSSLPLTSSLWLQGPPDTLIVESTQRGSSFFWTGLPDSVSLSASAWRGTGTEIVPSGDGSVVVAWSSVLGPVPSNLSAVTLEPHPMDASFLRSWGAALAAVDSLIASMLPVRQDPGHLLWVRGEGEGSLPPFRTAPSPPTPASVLHPITMPEGWNGTAMAGKGDPSTIPGITGIELPGLMEDPSLGPVISAVLERVLASGVIPLLGFDALFEVGYDDDGRITVWLVAPGGATLPEGAREMLLNALRDALLIPPGERLIGNAAVRASLLLGRTLDATPQNEVARELMHLLGSR